MKTTSLVLSDVQRLPNFVNGNNQIDKQIISIQKLQENHKSPWETEVTDVNRLKTKTAWEQRCLILTRSSIQRSELCQCHKRSSINHGNNYLRSVNPYFPFGSIYLKRHSTSYISHLSHGSMNEPVKYCNTFCSIEHICDTNRWAGRVENCFCICKQQHLLLRPQIGKNYLGGNSLYTIIKNSMHFFVVLCKSVDRSTFCMKRTNASYKNCVSVHAFTRI